MSVSRDIKHNSNSNEKSSSPNLKQLLCVGVIGSGLLFISYRLIKLWYNDESLPNTERGAQQEQRVSINNHADTPTVSDTLTSSSNTNLSTVDPRIARSLYENAQNMFKDIISFRPAKSADDSHFQLKNMKQYLKGKTIEQLATQLGHSFIYYDNDESAPFLYVNENEYYNATIQVYDQHDGPNLSLEYIHVLIHTTCAFRTLMFVLYSLYM